MESVYDSTAWQYGAEVLNGDTREVLVLAVGLRLGLGPLRKRSRSARHMQFDPLRERQSNRRARTVRSTNNARVPLRDAVTVNCSFGLVLQMG